MELASVRYDLKIDADEPARGARQMCANAEN